jgi:DNA polymerase sigma
MDSLKKKPKFLLPFLHPPGYSSRAETLFRTQSVPEPTASSLSPWPAHTAAAAITTPAREEDKSLLPSNSQCALLTSQLADFLQDLNLALLTIFQENLPDEKHEATQRTLLAAVRTCVQTALPDAQLLVFGSTAANLATRASDLDLALPAPATPAACKALLQDVACALSQEARFEVQEVLSSIRVPIIKLVDRDTGTAVDIGLAHPRSELKNELLRRYVALDARVAPLVMLVKQWCKARRIGQAASGGMNSFASTLMVIAFLQAVRPPVLPNLQSRVDAQTQHRQAAQPLALAEADSSEFLERSEAEQSFMQTVTAFSSFGAANTTSVATLLVDYFDHFAKFQPELACISVRRGGLVDACGYVPGVACLND